MDKLRKMIIEKGQLYPNGLLKVDRFINHQIDPELMLSIGREFKRVFASKRITKVLTIESSGIAPGLLTALELNVSLVFAKKTLPSTLMKDPVYETDVFSYTKQVTSKVVVAQSLIDVGDRILVIDDFLANGEAVLGLKNIVEQAGATIVGVGILIEKSFQPGREKLIVAGLPVHSLCRIRSIENGVLEFWDE